MRYNLTPLGRRVLNLVRAVRQIAGILPGEKINILGEKPATYLGAIEFGDFQEDYYQVHIFCLHDGALVGLETPNLNRTLGKYLL
jgi:hypothetical protein